MQRTYSTPALPPQRPREGASPLWRSTSSYNLSRLHLELADFTLKIHPADHFKETAKKEKGTRPGCIGILNNDESRRYMLKIENFHYLSVVTSSPMASVALESLCSKIIRHVFGTEYAPDINLIELQATSAPAIKLMPQLGVLSEWSEDCSTPDELNMTRTAALVDDTDKAIAEQATRMMTIAKLINMGDFKPDNIVKRPDGSLFLVDCSGLLNGFTNTNELFSADWTKSQINLGTLFQEDTALEIISKLAAIDMEKITFIIRSYAQTLPSTTREQLLSNITKTREMCLEHLNSHRQSSQPRLSRKS